MSSALRPGRGVRYRPSNSIGSKPPERAGIYYIYDSEGNKIYAGQAINLRKRVYQHKRNGKIPEGGYVDCFIAKEGITYDDLDSTERDKINKYNPPLNRRRGGGGRKSPQLERNSSTGRFTGSIVIIDDDRTSEKQRNYLYRVLGYERIGSSGEIFYRKEPKAYLFMLLELLVKILLIADALTIFLGLYLKMSKGIVFNQNILLGMVAIPIIFFLLFHYIRRSRLFQIIAIITEVSAIFLYFSSYSWSFN